MSKLLKNIVVASILIGTISVAFIILFGNNTSVLITKHNVGMTALTWYEFDTAKYITNLQTQITRTPELQLVLPTRSWNSDIINNMAVLVDYVIMILNVLLYPLKIGGYLINFVLAILGLNVDATSGIHWLGQMATTLIQLSIPYV